MASDFCTGCGTPYAEEEDRFCAKCGKPRAPEATASPSVDEEASASSPAPQIPTSKVGPIIGVVVLVAVIPLALMLGLGDCGSSEGQMQVSGGPHGSWTFVTTGCASMQPYGRMGANLHGAGNNDGAVYVSLDHARGHQVELEVPGSCQNADGTDCTVFEVPRDQCQTFDVSLDYTGTTVNDVRLVEGHVQLDCALEDGTRIEGQIQFNGC